MFINNGKCIVCGKISKIMALGTEIKNHGLCIDCIDAINKNIVNMKQQFPLFSKNKF